MLKKVWDFIKENVAVIITVATALLTVAYAILRFGLYAYWKGYFTRLNIDERIINLSFDKSIFAVVFVSIILLTVFFFVDWACQIIEDSKKKDEGSERKLIKKLFYRFTKLCKGILLSLIILFIVNIPLTLLLVPLAGTSIKMSTVIQLFLLLYVLELTFVLMRVFTSKKHKSNDKVKERDIVIMIIKAILCVFIVTVSLFWMGNQAIEKRTSIQLVENEEYMITYCGGNNYMLHRVSYASGEVIIYRNEQKIVDKVNCEISVKKVKKVEIRE